MYAKAINRLHNKTTDNSQYRTAVVMHVHEQQTLQIYLITVVSSYIIQIIIMLLFVCNNYASERGWRKGAVYDYKSESKNENCIIKMQLAS